MEKEVKLFDKRFVHFIWDDELKGKRGFLSSGIALLIKMVNENSDRTEIQKGCERDFPFCKHITVTCRFAYYDPNYEVKWAYYKEGKKVQVGDYIGNWADFHGEPHWSDNCKYRIKTDSPCEEKTFRPFKDCDELVEFWIERYQSTPKPMHTKPFIWVRLKVDKRERLIVAYGDNFVEIGNKTKTVTLQHLFEQYEFLDGKPCGRGGEGMKKNWNLIEVFGGKGR